MSEKKSNNSKRSLLNQPIIFFGMGRTGTSVISEIIMRHKKVAFLSQYLDRTPSFVGINYLRRLFDNRFWRIHGQKKQLNKVGLMNRYTFKYSEAYRMWNYLSGPEVQFSRSFLLDTVPSADKIKFIRSYFEKVVRYQGKQRLVFKITGPARLEYLQQIFPDAKFIRIQRNHVATLSSFIKVGFWKSRGLSKLWWQGAYTSEEEEWASENSENPVALSAMQLARVEEVTNASIANMNLDLLDIQYADFVQNPKKIISQILEFVDLEVDQACFDYLIHNKIVDRNKPDHEYFNEQDLITIRKFFKPKDALEVV